MNRSDSKHEQQRAGRIVSALHKYYHKLKRGSLYSLLFGWSGLFITGLLILIFIESAFYLTGVVKSISFASILLLSLFGTFYLYKKSTLPSFQNYFEEFFRSSDNGNALNAIDLYLNKKHQSSPFYQAAIKENLRGLDSADLSGKLKEFNHQSHTLKRFRFLSLYVLLSVGMMAFMGAKKTDGSMRAMHFWESYSQPNPYSFTVEPGSVPIEHGSSVQPSIQFHGDDLPDQVSFAFKTDVEENHRIRPMNASANGIFTSSGIELTSDISYRIEMDNFLSEEYRIMVQLQPRFDQLVAGVTPPVYTDLPEQTIEYPFSEISLYPGSTISFSGITNKPVEELKLLSSSGISSTIAPSEDTLKTHFETQINPESMDTLSFEMVDQEGLSNRNPYRTLLKFRQDQYPVVNIREPTGTVLETNPEEIKVLYQASDDFGLTRAVLRWQLTRAFVDDPVTGVESLTNPQPGRLEAYNWDLNEMDLRPRDQLTFHIRVWDNDEIAGAKWSESETVTIQIPSLTEYFEDLDSREREVDTNLDEVSENFDAMEQDYEQLLERLKQNPDGGYEEQQILQEIREQQESIDETVERMSENFEKLRSEMEKNDAVSDETRQAYRELQQLMEELDDPGLREAMEQLQKAMENMSPQDLEEALENMSFNEQLYKERLQRTVELFKRLKMNSDLDKLARQYEDLSERSEPKESQTTDQLNEEIPALKEDMESVSEQLDKLDENPPENERSNLRELKESSKQELDSIQKKLGEVDETLDNNSENGDQAPGEEIQQEQQSISEQLKKEAEKFRSSIKEMSGQQIQVNLLALQRSLYTLLELSDEQESLSQKASDTRNRNQGFVELAQSQKNVSDQFSNVADTLFQISSQLPGVPNQINRKKAEVEQSLNRALNQLTERSQRSSSILTRESLSGINDLSSMIASLIDQLMDQQGNGGGGGMSMQQMVEQMQQMSGDQQQLNQQLQEMVNDLQGNRLTQEQSERLDQLARQQNEIRRQLQELMQRGALNQGDRALSELQRMMEEMEDSIMDMRGGITDPIMVERQQNILSRMLNAEDALQERGEDEEREGTQPPDFDRTFPPEMTLQELQQEIRSRLQDPNYTRFSDQYQQLIELYFEQLRKLEENQLP